MTHAPPMEPPRRKAGPAWLAAALCGIAAPAAALLTLSQVAGGARPALIAGPLLAIVLMGAGMIAAAAAGRLWIGIACALLAGGGLVLCGTALEMLPARSSPSTAFALLVASLSFAARGALFARSAADRGWWIALGVVAGEAAVLLTASASPGALPGWLLSLLPAQWASAAIAATFGDTGMRAAPWELTALAGTAATTLLVTALWPRRWPYLVMFAAWIGLSALVWVRPALPGFPPDAGAAITRR